MQPPAVDQPKPSFWGPEGPLLELCWRGLCLRPEVEPPSDVWPPGPLLKATLRSGRWEVTPNRDGHWVAAWRYQGVNIRSTRDTATGALEALMHFVRYHEANEGLQQLSRDAILTDLASLSG